MTYLQKKPLIYVAGPYTKPDPVENTHRAIKVADQILEMGGIPVIPHQTLLWHIVSPKPYEAWMEIDAQHLLRCDALYRIPGESAGADREVRLAEAAGISVFLDMDILRMEIAVYLGGQL